MNFLKNSPDLSINYLKSFLNRKASIYLMVNSIKIYFYPLPVIIFIYQVLINRKGSIIKKLFFKNKKFIILLQKDGFNQDTKYISNYFNNLECITISRDLIKAIAKCFLPKEIDDNNYQSASIIHNKRKERLFKFYDYLFSNLPKKFKPIGFLTGNYGYFAEQELFKAAYKNDIKGIAIHKECLKTQGRIELFNYIYSVRRSIFEGTLILVYNNKEKKLQKESQVFNPDKTKIKVIGAPRIDQAHRLRKTHNILSKHKIILFGFGLRTGLPSITRKSHGGSEPHNEFLKRSHEFLNWEKLLKGICIAYYDCAKKYPEVEFIVKLKGSYRDNYYMLDFFQKQSKLKNLKINLKGNAINLINDASIIIGFNSTSIFEGIARGSKVIIPKFGECNLKEYKPYYIDLIDSDIFVAKSESSLKSIIKKCLSKKPFISQKLTPNQKILLNEWVGNSDGKSTLRLIENLRSELL
tara:strand:+ start:2463 stop:3863 length:1401 start_codon:yes stop_codon:yes gene_type:complete